MVVEDATIDGHVAQKASYTIEMSTGNHTAYGLNFYKGSKFYVVSAIAPSDDEAARATMKAVVDNVSIR